MHVITLRHLLDEAESTRPPVPQILMQEQSPSPGKCFTHCSTKFLKLTSPNLCMTPLSSCSQQALRLISPGPATLCNRRLSSCRRDLVLRRATSADPHCRSSNLSHGPLRCRAPTGCSNVLNGRRIEVIADGLTLCSPPAHVHGRMLVLMGRHTLHDPSSPSDRLMMLITLSANFGGGSTPWVAMGCSEWCGQD